MEGVIAAAFYYAWGFASGGVKPSANVLKKIAGVLNIGVGIVKKRIKEIGDVLVSARVYVIKCFSLRTFKRIKRDMASRSRIISTKN